MPTTTPLVWEATIALIIGLLAFDYFFHVRKAHAPTLREAATWSALYVGIALLFGIAVWTWGGADMGAERFFNIKCRASGESPDAAVVVATTRALKMHSGKFKITAGKPLPPDMLAENPGDVEAGAANLVKQIENIRIHGVSPVVAINAFPTDHPSEHDAIRRIAESAGARAAAPDHRPNPTRRRRRRPPARRCPRRCSARTP